jgi:hypothetical protein
MVNLEDYLPILLVAGFLLGLWLLAGRPNGTEIYLGLLSPLGAIDRLSERVVAIRDDPAQSSWKRVIAAAVAKVGLVILFVLMFAGFIVMKFGRTITRAFFGH